MTHSDGAQRTRGERAREETRMHVCLIDASPDRAQRLQRTFREFDATVVVDTFADGAAALEALTVRSVSPALILLALDLPGRRSWAVLAARAADGRLRRVPVVVLTSADRGADRTRAYELGASGDITAATLVQDLQATVAHTRLYWQAMTYTPPAGHCGPPV